MRFASVNEYQEYVSFREINYINQTKWINFINTTSQSKLMNSPSLQVQINNLVTSQYFVHMHGV